MIERRSNVRHIGSSTFRDTPTRAAWDIPERIKADLREPEWMRRRRTVGLPVKDLTRA